MRVPIERPARRVELSYASEKLRPDAERQTERAREQMRIFLEENDVYFNGAAEEGTAASPLGTAQVMRPVHAYACASS